MPDTPTSIIFYFPIFLAVYSAASFDNDFVKKFFNTEKRKIIVFPAGQNIFLFESLENFLSMSQPEIDKF